MKGKPKPRRHISEEAIKQALWNSWGNISLAAESLGVKRQNLSVRIHQSKELEIALVENSDRLVDLAENKLIALLTRKDKDGHSDPEPSAVFFALKCKGKRRGYVERQELEHSGKVDGDHKLELVIIDPAQPAKDAT
jgi:hypothetical protein